MFPSRVGGKRATDTEVVAATWKIHFESLGLLNLSKTYNMNKYVKQNLNNHDNVNNISNHMCDRYKFAAPINKLPLTWATAIYDILADHIT